MYIYNHGIYASSPSNPLWNGLFAVYKAENNTNDSLGVYNGTAQGGLTYTTGKSGNSFLFNGTNAYVALPNNSFNFAGDFSISSWVKFASLSSWQNVISNFYSNGTTQKGWNITVNPTGTKLNFSVYQSLTTYLALSYNINAYINQLINIVIVKTSTNHKMYINGSLVASSVAMSPAYNTTQYCSIGNINDNTNYTDYMSNGSIVDELCIWDREITSTEVTELYNSGLGTFY